MGVVLPYLETSALRPGLLAELPALGEAFQERGAIRVERVLEPGLAAELAVLLRRMPFGPHYAHDDTQRLLAWLLRQRTARHCRVRCCHRRKTKGLRGCSVNTNT